MICQVVKHNRSLVMLPCPPENQIMNEHCVPHSDITELFPLAGNFLREHLPPTFLQAAGKTAEKGTAG